MTPAEAIAHLKASGMTEKAIGTAVGVSQSAINKISRNDMNPNWQIGQALVQLAGATSLPLPANSDTQQEAA